MIVILSYAIAFIITMVVTNLAYLILIPFKPITSKYQLFAPVPQFLVSVTGALGAVFTYVTIALNTSLVIAYFMLLLPALYLLWNNIQRVSRAKEGNSQVRQILEAKGEEYNQKADVFSEQASEAGHIIGYLVGMLLFVGKAGFFI